MPPHTKYVMIQGCGQERHGENLRLRMGRAGAGDARACCCCCRCCRLIRHRVCVERPHGNGGGVFRRRRQPTPPQIVKRQLKRERARPLGGPSCWRTAGLQKLDDTQPRCPRHHEQQARRHVLAIRRQPQARRRQGPVAGRPRMQWHTCGWARAEQVAGACAPPTPGRVETVFCGTPAQGHNEWTSEWSEQERKL